MRYGVPSLALAILLTAAAPGARGEAAEPPPLPRIEVEATEVDAGPRLCYRDVAHDFRFRNTGGSPLSVKVVKRSCGCTGGLVSSEAIPPGGEGTLQVSYKATPSQPRKGNQHFAMTLGTNDPTRLEVIFTLKVRLVETVDVAPSLIDFGGVTASTGVVERPFSVVAYKDPEAPEIRSVKASGEGLSIRSVGREDREDAVEHRYVASLDTERLGGDLQARIVVETASSRVPVLEVPVKATVPLPLQARPTRVLFGTLKTPAAVEKSVSLVAGQAGPTPLRADATDPRIAAEVRAAEAPGQWTLAVHLDPEKAPLPAEKSETIRADVLVRAEDGKLVGKVPVHAVLSAQGP